MLLVSAFFGYLSRKFKQIVRLVFFLFKLAAKLIESINSDRSFQSDTYIPLAVKSRLQHEMIASHIRCAWFPSNGPHFCQVTFLKKEVLIIST